MNIQKLIEKQAIEAFINAGITNNVNPQVKQSSKSQFGDYQINGVMSAAKEIGENPRQLAEKIMTHLKLGEVAEKVEIAGAGFINIYLSKTWLNNQAHLALADKDLNVSKPQQQTVVVDYSAPNVAKEMHVGHLRSTIIGDAVVRTLEFLGHKVIRANHIGDWGTQFGMLIANLERLEQDDPSITMTLSDLEGFYRESKVLYDSDEEFAKKARQYVVKLQSGDKYCLSMWQKLVDVTLAQNQTLYDRLDVSLTRKDTMGESMYNDMLPEVVNDLLAKKIAVIDQEAKVVFLDSFKNKDGDPMGVIIQKRDGGYLYTTTDIACVKYRFDNLKADRILYYIDSRQHQHLLQIWEISQLAGYSPKGMPISHHAFGMMLGKDGKPFKTRSGGTISLYSLLDEAEVRAYDLVKAKNPNMDDAELRNVAKVIGIASVKYADLSKNRMTDYIFDWDLMLSFDGNTAPYLQYAYARIMSIFRNANVDMNTFTADIVIATEQEKQLITALIQLEETLQVVVTDGYPHVLCAYIYHVAGLFSRFYEACPILANEDKSVQQSRLAIAALSARTIKTGLNLLGINTLEKM